MKVAVIDIGSNTIKLAIYSVKKDNSFIGFHHESSKVSLGASMVYSDSLDDQSINKAMDVLLLYRDTAKFESVKKIICIGTSAIREAKNSKHFIDQVYLKTGLKVRILSGEEEAYYSYLGAGMSTCIRNGLYFDLGGGSLELVYTDVFKIKKAEALPLGALRLTRTFANKDNSFSRNDCDSMFQTIEKTLPTKKSYSIGIDTLLVGIGGTLRALGKYDQKRKGYPFEKIHNYKLTLSALDSLRKDLSYLKTDQISNLWAFDSTRAETIVAGIHVIQSLMKRFDFEEVIISGYGLREGILASFINDPNSSQNNNLARLTQQITHVLSYNCNKNNVSDFGLDDMMRYMTCSGLLKEREVQILSYALSTLTRLPETNKVYSLFHLILDEDYPDLTLREQIVLALSIVYSKKVRIAEELFYQYSYLVKSENLKSIQKIASLLKLARILVKTKSQVRVKESKNETLLFSISSIHNSLRPSILLQYIMQKISSIFGIPVQYTLSSSPLTNSPLDEVISVSSQG